MISKNWLIFTFLLLALVSLENPAWARRRGNSRASAAARIRALQAQAKFNIAVASKVLQDATIVGVAAEGKVNQSKALASSAADQGKSAKDEIKSETDRMHEIEDKIANAQAQDSAFIKALDAYEDASDDYHEMREGILNSTEYKTRLSRANAIPNSSEQKRALDDLKFEMFTSNRDFTAAVAMLESTKSNFEKLRMELLSADSDWMDAAKAVREARVTEADSKDRLTGAGINKMAAGQKLRAAKQTAAEAQQVIAANQAILNSLPKQKGSTPSKAVAKKK